MIVFQYVREGISEGKYENTEKINEFHHANGNAPLLFDWLFQI